MEIDFMILWKSKVSDKTDLLPKIKEMLIQLFTNVKNDHILFTDKDNNVFEIPYKCSKSNNEVYLKIECNYSEAQSAKILSAIRDNIIQGKHRADYSIICTFDEASLSYCCRLMKPFGVFERRLRELMYLITVKAFGIDWIEKSFPKEMIDEVKKKANGKNKITETAFELLDYSEIINYLFKERRFEYTAEQVIDDELSDEKLKSLSKNEIIDIILKSRKETLWNKLFSKNKNIGSIKKDDIESLRKYRNDVMHHHTLNENDFKLMQKSINSINKKLKNAINEIECKIYTEREYGTIWSLTGSIIAGITDTFNKMIDTKIFDITQTMSMTIKKLSENIISNIVKPIEFPNYSKILQNIVKPIELPDYSKILQNIVKPIELPNYSGILGNIAKPIELLDCSKDLETPEESKKDSDDVENE